MTIALGLWGMAIVIRLTIKILIIMAVGCARYNLKKKINKVKWKNF